MPENTKKKVTPKSVLNGESPFILTASLEPIAGDRFQPAGFPEIGHVMYKAPRKDGTLDSVCIVDSAASMANHLESVCMRGAHDLDLVDDLAGMPYLRCVTGSEDGDTLPSDEREVVFTTLTEGHRIASSYFLDGVLLENDGSRKKAAAKSTSMSGKKSGKSARATSGEKLEDDLVDRFGIVLSGSSKAHPPADKWWSVFKTIFELDPNSLVHGVLFPQWQIKIPRFLTAHLEAFGAARVDRSGVKFDRLGKTTSGQPIFAVDDATAESIRATFVFDVSLVRSFGRASRKEDDANPLGLTDSQKEFLVALAIWKVARLVESPFRFRSGCHLRCTSLASDGEEVELDVNIRDSITRAEFRTFKGAPLITDVYWPREELYRDREEPIDTPEAEANADGNGHDEV
jgi:CRISPR-associated protein Csb1